MKYEPVTLKDIAKALGLSKSTVSRALTNGLQTNHKTRKKVLDYAEKINYRPNPIALQLKDRKSHSIGVIMGEIDNNFFSQVIDGIESIAYDQGYHVFITQNCDRLERERSNLALLSSRSVDGLIVSLSVETENTDHFQSLFDQGLPIIFVDRVPEKSFTHRVIIDNFKSAFDATEQLIQTGHKNIAYVAPSPNFTITQQRFDGFRAALKKHGHLYRDENVVYCCVGPAANWEVQKAIDAVMSLPSIPDALFTANDRVTTESLLALKNYAGRLPSNFTITGYTNSTVTNLFDASLTIIRQPAFEMGEIAMKLLVSLIDDDEQPSEYKTEVLTTTLITKSA